MSSRIPVILLLAVLASAVACSNKKVNNPIANIDSKQPDKVLFDRAMDAMKHNRFDVARITLQTLINTYPDSEFIARAKLAVADSWYAEGGTTAWAQAEVEYNDFKTFFPNMPEAAEAQLKIANIHYQQMEKPDRDYTHAVRAVEEYRNLIQQFPENKLVPEAKQRLLEVQEVIADREFHVGRFYYLRQSYPASIARLRSLVDKYPLYSKADEALFLLGQSYEGEVTMLRQHGRMDEASKSRLIQEFTKGAAEAYSRILTRYPLMDRADDAKARLQDLHQPVPRPTKAAVAQNKAEEDSRRVTPMYKQVMSTFNRHPDTAQAAKVGEPTLVNPQMMSPTDVVQQANQALRGTGGATMGNNSVSVEAVGKGAPPADQPAPRSDVPVTNNAVPPVGNAAPGVASSDPNDLKPNLAAADANELKPNVASDGSQAMPPPQQVNELQGGASAPAASDGKAADAASSSSQEQDDNTVSSSKHKKKKGLRKVVPF
jgi:outer membrane protein assembly factor BamD